MSAKIIFNGVKDDPDVKVFVKPRGIVPIITREAEKSVLIRQITVGDSTTKRLAAEEYGQKFLRLNEWPGLYP